MSTENSSFLPPINKKVHRLNTEKALNQTSKNFVANHDSGQTSDAYKINQENVAENVINLYEIFNFSLLIRFKKIYLFIMKRSS